MPTSCWPPQSPCPISWLRRSLPKSAGEPASTVPPRLASFVRTSHGCVRTTWLPPVSRHLASAGAGPERYAARRRQRLRSRADRTRSPPKVLEPLGRHFGVPDRMLDVFMPELPSPRVVAIIGELEPAGMAKHVRVDWEWHLGGLAEALDEPMEPNGTDWSAALGDEYVGVLRVLAS